MKINLEGWQPFKSLQHGQWYSREDRPQVMSRLATVFGANATSALALAVRARYFSSPYQTDKWFDLDGEIARVASEVLNET